MLTGSAVAPAGNLRRTPQARVTKQPWGVTRKLHDRVGIRSDNRRAVAGSGSPGKLQKTRGAQAQCSSRTRQQGRDVCLLPPPPPRTHLSKSEFRNSLGISRVTGVSGQDKQAVRRSLVSAPWPVCGLTLPSNRPTWGTVGGR